jgi:hypothetical protein
MNNLAVSLNRIYSKPLLTIGFLLIVHNLYILYSHQPKGYVVDIYSVLPLFFYGTSILCYFIISIVLLSDHGIRRRFGILLLVLNHATILLIPFMLGYYSMGRADDMSYIGEYVHISKTGSISGWDIYPGSHILGAILAIISGLPGNDISFIMPVIFSFIFIGGLCLCCRFFLKEEKQVNIAVLSSFIFYLGPYNFLNVPHALFFAYMPLYIFFLSRHIKRYDSANAVLILIPTLLIPFMHPFIIFFAVILLLFLILSWRLLNRFIQGDYRRTAGLLVVLVTGFFSWFIYCEALMGDFGRSYRAYLEKITEPVLFETTDKLARINIDFFKMIKLLIIYYGRYFIPMIIICMALALAYIKRDKIPLFLKDRMYFFFIFYITFLVVEMTIFLNPIISHQADRMTNLNFIVYAQVPLFALSLSVIFEESKLFNRQTILLLIILTGIWGMSLFGTFDSPNIFRPNVALTYNEVKGMEWYYEARNNNNVIVPLSQIGRFHTLFDNGESEHMISIPDHFGYNSTDMSFAETNLKYGQQSYIILLTIDELLYQMVPGYKEVGRYTAKDYARFRNDQSVEEKIYDGQNIEVYNVFSA